MDCRKLRSQAGARGPVSTTGSAGPLPACRSPFPSHRSANPTSPRTLSSDPLTPCHWGTSSSISLPRPCHSRHLIAPFPPRYTQNLFPRHSPPHFPHCFCPHTTVSLSRHSEHQNSSSSRHPGPLSRGSSGCAGCAVLELRARVCQGTAVLQALFTEPLCTTRRAFRAVCFLTGAAGGHGGRKGRSAEQRGPRPRRSLYVAGWAARSFC